MTIYDTFLFSGELDMLECRLYELQDTAVHHVIVEAPLTFQGRPKPMYYAEHGDRFAAWADRITYVQAAPQGTGPWQREHASREAVWQGLGDADPDDLVLHSDVDEIPFAATVELLQTCDLPVKCSLRCAVFAVDWELPWPWNAISAARLSQVSSFTALRDLGGPVLGPASGTGWHLSWMGGHAAMHRKVNSFSHTEMLAEISAGIDAGKYLERGLFWGHAGHGGQTQLIARDVDQSWPRWVAERKCPAVWFRPREAGGERGGQRGAA